MGNTWGRSTKNTHESPKKRERSPVGNKSPETVNRVDHTDPINSSNNDQTDDQKVPLLSTQTKKDYSSMVSSNNDEETQSNEKQSKQSSQLDINELKAKPTDKYNKRSSINPKSAFQALNLEEVPYWKNACKIDIDKVKYVWIYSSYYGNGWWHMSPEVNDHIENLYQMWKRNEDISQKNHLRINGGDFKYNFDKMCQINRNTNTNRTVRRLDIDQLQQIEQHYVEKIGQSEHVWLYQAGNKYVPFMPQFQEEIEAAYQDFSDHSESDKYVHYELKYPNGYNYQLNFRRMSQVNRQTGVKRTISRVPNNELVDHPEYQVSSGFSQSYKFPQKPPAIVDLSKLDTPQQTMTTSTLTSIIDNNVTKKDTNTSVYDQSDPFASDNAHQSIVHSPKKVSPVPSPRKESPVKSPKRDSPVPSPRKESPVPSPRKESPVPSPRKESPVKSPRKVSPDSTPQRDLPVNSPRKSSPDPTPQRDSPVPSPKRNSPVKSPKKVSPDPSHSVKKELSPVESPNLDNQSKNPTVSCLLNFDQNSSNYQYEPITSSLSNRDVESSHSIN